MPAKSLETGLRCPKCSCNRWWTVNVWWLRGGRIRRRRKCRQCGRPLFTVERTQLDDATEVRRRTA